MLVQPLPAGTLLVASLGAARARTSRGTRDRTRPRAGGCLGREPERAAGRIDSVALIMRNATGQLYALQGIFKKRLWKAQGQGSSSYIGPSAAVTVCVVYMSQTQNDTQNIPQDEHE
jgi:hypothetical protein